VRLHPTAARRGGPVAAAVVATALLLGACGGGDAPASDSDPAPSTAASPAEDAEESVNPVVADDFPDPDVLEVDDVYYAYATEGNLRNVRVARSDDLLEWETLPDALPDLPSWVIPGKTWAPEVTEIAPGQYAMYFTATNFRPSFQCIGAATATSPEGPFTVEGMLVCPAEEGGAIDASTFLDADGTRYLLWKNDGNCCGLDTWLQIAPLAPDGLSLAAPPTRLVQQDLEWEGHLVEAPTLVERDGVYTLLYSANDYGGPSYAIGYATASSVLGPYTKAAEPLLTTRDAPQYVGPGGQDVVLGPDGEDRLVFHSWYVDRTYRGMNVLPLTWEDGVPRVVVD
jgi:arabinan endo-1,5-alpha-L-arabinosidase